MPATYLHRRTCSFAKKSNRARDLTQNLINLSCISSLSQVATGEKTLISIRRSHLGEETLKLLLSTFGVVFSQLSPLSNSLNCFLSAFTLKLFSQASSFSCFWLFSQALLSAFTNQSKISFSFFCFRLSFLLNFQLFFFNFFFAKFSFWT